MKLDEKISELKGAKLVKYLNHQLEYGRHQEILSLYPGIMHQHPDIGGTLDRIRQTAAAAVETASTDIPGHQIKQHQCTGCGASLNLNDNQATVIACQYCGTISSEEHPDDQKSLNAGKPNHFKPYRFIRLGDEAEFDGMSYKVVGRMVYSGSCYEWDDEDRSYERCLWRFDEWLLLGSDRRFRYLVEDKEGCMFAKDFVPSQPSIPVPGQHTLSLQNDVRAQQITERGDYQLAYFEGEFGWLPQIKEQLKTWEYEYKRQIYSVETRHRGDSPDQEIEFYVTKKIDRRSLLKAFKRETELNRLMSDEQVQKDYTQWSWIAGIAGIVILIFGLLNSTRSGNPVFQQTVSLNQISQNGLLLGPVQMDKVNTVYRTIMKASGIQDNQFTWVGAELINAQNQAVNALVGDFWRESGRDSEGPWSESKLKTKDHFRLTTPGEYYFRLFLDPGSDKSGRLSFEVYQGIRLARYFIIPGLLLLGLAASIRRYKTVNPVYAIVGILALIFLFFQLMEKHDH